MTRKLPLLLSLLSLLASAAAAAANSTTAAPAPANTIKELVESLLSAPYSSHIRPLAGQRRPDIVNISISLNDFADLNAKRMDFTTSVYFRRIWRDERLKFNSSLTDVLSIGYMVSKVWQPDIYFVNEKSGIAHDITVPNILLQLFPDGRIILSNKYSLVISCKFQLELYPMDSQECNIDFGSYGYRTDDLILQWSDVAGVVLGDTARSLPEYDVIRTTQHDCTSGFAVTGRYTCLRATLHLKRKFNYYLIQVYIPSMLIVVLSWVSFWIDSQATPARITLGLLTVLTITTQSSSIRADMPRVSYVKAIDVWLTGCLTFVFMALIEFAAVNVMQRKPKPRRGVERNSCTSSSADREQYNHGEENLAVDAEDDKQHQNHHQHQHQNQQQQQHYNHSDADNGTGSSCFLFRNKYSIASFLTCRCFAAEGPHEMDDAEFVDFLARFFFPGSFIVFNAVYWTYYKIMEVQSSFS